MAKQAFVAARCSKAERERWRLAAKRSGRTLSGWIRWVLEHVSRTQTEAPKGPIP